jgi:hypothetical protein
MTVCQYGDSFMMGKSVASTIVNTCERYFLVCRGYRLETWIWRSDSSTLSSG